jgi:hypothetical protein
MQRVPMTMGMLTFSPIKVTARIIAKRGEEEKIGLALATPMYLIPK